MANEAVTEVNDTITELTSKRDALIDEHIELEKRLKATNELCDKADTQLTVLKQAIQDQQEAVNKLKTDQHELLDSVNELKSTITELETTKEKLTGSIADLKQAQASEKWKLDGLENDYDTLLDKKTDELNAVLQKTSDCLTRLKEFETTEHDKRSELAKDIMAMDKERESLLMLKAQSSELDKQVAHKKQYMKL